MRSRRLLTVVVLGVVPVLVGTACRSDFYGGKGSNASPATTAAAGPAGPQRYMVVVDGPSTLGAENLVYGTYFPKTVAVRPGDTVVFDNRSSNDIHTVSFGVKSDRSDQPPVVLKNGQQNPAVFGPCFTSEPARADLAACPAKPTGAGAPPFTGKGFWNSGVVAWATAPPEAGSKTATVTLAPDIAPGVYTVSCLLHPFMEATLRVVTADAERQSPAEVAAAADRELGEAKARATALTVPVQATVANGATVSASWGDQLVAVNRFAPETVSIKVGQTVTWRDASPFMPHTVSFQPPFKSPDEPNAFLPIGAKSGSPFAGGVAHSGIFGPKPVFPADGFSLTFTKAGTYPYLCLLHPGMAGTVQVG
jgi:plastocyanin